MNRREAGQNGRAYVRLAWIPSEKRSGSSKATSRATDAPNFERYGESFDPRSGTGGVEIWIPIEK